MSGGDKKEKGKLQTSAPRTYHRAKGEKLSGELPKKNSKCVGTAAKTGKPLATRKGKNWIIVRGRERNGSNSYSPDIPKKA